MSDNLTNMETSVSDPHVVTAVCGNKLRSIIASVDDYLMNLAIAEDICCYVLD
ncbi:MAG: KEOPS complex subunit Pcc1 [Euryarchaeota archaeon]|nr:KEOPS complex subunit Pcc1 [Euryarchaeota archaeon]